jgi:hypothetical protein
MSDRFVFLPALVVDIVPRRKDDAGPDAVPTAIHFAVPQNLGIMHRPWATTPSAAGCSRPLQSRVAYSLACRRRGTVLD